MPSAASAKSELRHHLLSHSMEPTSLVSALRVRSEELRESKGVGGEMRKGDVCSQALREGVFCSILLSGPLEGFASLVPHTEAGLSQGGC